MWALYSGGSTPSDDKTQPGGDPASAGEPLDCRPP